MIGKKFDIKGMEIEITKDLGDKWGIRSPTNPDVDTIDKDTLDYEMNVCNAVEITE